MKNLKKHIKYEKMNVLSLFDGMSCGQIALKELGVTVKDYYAAEIDKFAIEQTKLNFPKTQHLGSVVDVKAKDLAKIDLLIGGSPCQGFSRAGKQLNFDDPRSKLFFEFVRLWNEIKAINPKAVFLLENVNMKRDCLRIISEYMGVFPVRINSNLVSAQNRDRWYWTNIKTKDVGLFNELWSDIPQPTDRGLLLGDVLQDESDVDEKYFLSDKAVTTLLKHQERSNLNGWGFAPIFHQHNKKMSSLKVGGKGTNDIVYATSGFVIDKKRLIQKEKSNCIDANYFKGLDNHGQRTGVAIRGRIENLVASLREVRTDEAKAQRRETGSNDFRGKKFELRDDGKVATLQSSLTNEHSIISNCKLRRLTPTECARLQTIPDWYVWKCSDTQQYKMLGNGWTVDVIKHIFSFIKF